MRPFNLPARYFQIDGLYFPIDTTVRSLLHISLTKMKRVYDRFVNVSGETNFPICATVSCPELYRVVNILLNCTNPSKNKVYF